MQTRPGRQLIRVFINLYKQSTLLSVYLLKNELKIIVNYFH